MALKMTIGTMQRVAELSHKLKRLQESRESLSEMFLENDRGIELSIGYIDLVVPAKEAGSKFRPIVMAAIDSQIEGIKREIRELGVEVTE